MTDLEQQAREVLEKAIRDLGEGRMADNFRDGHHPIIITSEAALNAMLAFRAAQPGEGHTHGAAIARLGAQIDSGEAAGGITREIDGKRYVVMPWDQYEGDLNRRFERGKAAALAKPRPDREAVLNEAVEPWKDFHGDLPDYDHPLRCVFESGVQYTVELLAKELGVEDWTPCDGTEEFDGDLGGTLVNIVMGSLPTDQDGDHYHPRDIAALLPAAPVQEMPEGEQIAESANCSGWIVTDGGGETYRTWQHGFSGWTKDRDKATRYARRQDAEAVHAEDEDAWRVIPFGPSEDGLFAQDANKSGGEDGWREERERLRAALRDMVGAMRRYEMDVDDDPPGTHREMMRRAEALSEPQEQGEGK